MPKGIYKRGVVIRKPHSKETRAKIALSNTGKTHSVETIEKIRLSKIGKKYPNRKKYFKGRTVIKKECSHCHKDFFFDCSARKDKFCSINCRAKANSESWEKGLASVNRDYQKQVASSFRGELHPRWVKDRTLLKDDHKDRGGQLHREWSRGVKNRDGWKCKMSNEDCNGKLVSHHILPWKDYPELRYELNNGITLCKFHHPVKRIDEIKTISYFQKLLTSS